MSNAQAFAADVTDEAAVGRAIERASDAMGGIDGLVSAAGVMMRGGVLEIGLQEWRRVIDVNLTGSFIVVRACLPFMRQAPAASIVTLGSAQGLLPNVPNRTAYAASKGGLVNLTRALAAELAPKIRVNCVCPGLVDTPMADGVRGNVCNYALGRIAEPMEIANAILFLTSYESSYVTGATLAADGGRSFH
jgi:NAD(P)-dependent dehydrogenase (short-subunit alcohol dehydrogenase family)